MLIYIFKSVACMAIFFVFYKLLLEKENMHFFKRFYLLLALGASLLIPAVVFTEYVIVEPALYVEKQQPVFTDYDYIGIPAALEEDVLDIEPILWTIYFFGLIFFGLKFIKNLGQIIGRIRKNPKQKSASFIQVLLQENFPPHTFFKYIFLNKKKLESNEIPKEVLLHEETHAKQKHSWDVVFIELLQVIFWFNPLVFLFKKAIKLNHEFLADQAVLDNNIDKTTYQNTLLSYLSPDSQNKYQSKMANAINYSSIKKRFTVMKTQTSKKAILFRSLLLLPLLALLLLGFSETKLIEVSSTNTSTIEEAASHQELTSYNELAKKYNAVPIEKRKIPLTDLKILESVFRKMSTEQKASSQPFPECLPKNIQEGVTQKQLDDYYAYATTQMQQTREQRRNTPGHIVKKMMAIYYMMSASQKKAVAETFPDLPPPPPPREVQDGASREVMKEYNLLAKKYNTMLSEGKSIQIKKQDVDRLEYIYSLMSDKQKADAEPFPDFPEPPPPPKAPMALKGEISTIPPPPSGNALRVLKGEVSDVPLPPAPPEPMSPLDHVIEMAKKGATFYYEGRKVSSDRAIELLKKNQDLNIQSTGGGSKKPAVKISKEPIYLDRSATPSSIETGNVEIMGDEGFYSKKDGITSYFNSKGEQIDKTGKVLNRKSNNNPKFYFDNEQISSEKANRLLSSNKSIQVTSKEFADGSYALLLTDLNSSFSQDPNRNYNPNSVIDLTEMIAKDALFFHNDKPITAKKALWLTQNNLIERVNTIRPKKGKPRVYFWDKA